VIAAIEAPFPFARHKILTLVLRQPQFASLEIFPHVLDRMSSYDRKKLETAGS
jgi:hypothetical protein